MDLPNDNNGPQRFFTRMEWNVCVSVMYECAPKLKWYLCRDSKFKYKHNK